MPFGIGRLQKNGGQRSDLISLLPNNFIYKTVPSFCYLYELVNENLDFFYILNEKIVRSAACLNLFLIFEDLNKINSFSKTARHIWLKFCMKNLWDLCFYNYKNENICSRIRSQ